MQLSDKQRRILRWVGYPLLALFTFLLAAHLTFPYERVKDKLVEVISAKYDVTIGGVSRTLLPGGMILENVVLRTRPAQPDEEPAEVVFGRIEVDVSLLSLVMGRADVDIEAAVGSGSIEGNVELSRSQVAAHFATSALPLDSLPGVREAVGLPAKGGLNAKLDLTLPEGHWDKANGMLTLSCPGCTVGDGTSKIKPRARPGRRPNPRFMAFAGEGVTVPELNLGNLSARIVIKDGKGVVEEFTGTSKDGELALKANIQFTRQFKDSRFESGCMKFKLSSELKQREPKFGSVPELMIASPVDADGFSNVKLKGKLLEMRWVPARDCNLGDDDDDGDGERPSSSSAPLARPSISSSPPPSEPITPEDTTPGSMPAMGSPADPLPPEVSPPDLDPGLKDALRTEDFMGTATPPHEPARRLQPSGLRDDDVSGLPPEIPPWEPDRGEPDRGEPDRGEPDRGEPRDPPVEEEPRELERGGPQEDNGPRDLEDERGNHDEYER